MNSRKLIVFTFIFLASCLFCLEQTAAEEIRKADYPVTILALYQLYNAKIMASDTDSELAQEALEERYYSVAGLFSALSESGAVHARNYRSILDDLGVVIEGLSKSEILTSDTKENLEFFLAAELSKIDINYPQFIESIKPEENKRALEEITYAWKTEMQQRDLIKKMKTSLSAPAEKIVDNMKGVQEYYVCQRCGSIVFNLPETPCIICGSLVAAHKIIKSQAMSELVGSDINKPDRSNDLFVDPQAMSGSYRSKPVPRVNEWFIDLFTLNPIIFVLKSQLAYDPTWLEGSMLTHYIEKELKLRIDPRIPVKVGSNLSELKNIESVENKDYLISCVTGEIQDILITSKKNETWGVLKVKYIYSEQRINSLYRSRKTKQVQIIPSDNSTDKTPESILVHKNLTRDDMEKLLQNAAKEIVDRVVLTLPSVQERTK